jgi:hypothetical protein
MANESKHNAGQRTETAASSAHPDGATQGSQDNLKDQEGAEEDELALQITEDVSSKWEPSRYRRSWEYDDEFRDQSEARRRSAAFMLRLACVAILVLIVVGYFWFRRATPSHPPEKRGKGEAAKRRTDEKALNPTKPRGAKRPRERL